ncbi:MAG: hypothetical protein KF693_02720 [Nitrospira sp.]|nr:hypothetical protein [Nitrospira sp.]
MAKLTGLFQLVFVSVLAAMFMIPAYVGGAKSFPCRLWAAERGGFPVSLGFPL